MTRKQRNLAFWILVFSLNLIPLVAHGGGDGGGGICGVNEDCTAGDDSTAQALAITNGSAPAAAQAPAPGAHRAKPAARHLAKSNKPDTQSASPVPSAAPSPAPSAAPSPAPSLAPAAAAQHFGGAAKDLSMSDLTGNGALVMDFDARVEGANPNNSAKLMGRIFANCQRFLEISHAPKAPGCGSNAGFRIHDTGGFQACMNSHKHNDRYEPCTEDASSEQACIFLSELPNHAAQMDLSALGAVDIQLVHRNPNGNEEHQNVCENFTTNLHHLDQNTMTAAAAAHEAEARQNRIDAAQSLVRNCHHTEDELQTAYRACTVLATLGVYHTQAECVTAQRLDKYGIQILANRAAHDSIDSLDDVANSLIEWANAHPSECGKVVEPLHTIARRQATQQIARGRNSDRSPLDGYDAAMGTIQSAIDGASCLSDNDKLLAMQENLQINRTEKIGETNGMYSMEFQSQYADLMQTAYTNYADSCNSWEMDTSCTAATRQLQSAMAVQSTVSAATQRQAQAQASLCQMVARSSNGMMMPPQCQSMMMGGMGTMGMGGLGYGSIGSSSYGFGRL